MARPNAFYCFIDIFLFYELFLPMLSATIERCLPTSPRFFNIDICLFFRSIPSSLHNSHSNIFFYLTAIAITVALNRFSTKSFPDMCFENNTFDPFPYFVVELNDFHRTPFFRKYLSSRDADLIV